jgi:hypothetical protein
MMKMKLAAAALLLSITPAFAEGRQWTVLPWTPKEQRIQDYTGVRVRPSAIDLTSIMLAPCPQRSDCGARGLSFRAAWVCFSLKPNGRCEPDAEDLDGERKVPGASFGRSDRILFDCNGHYLIIPDEHPNMFAGWTLNPIWPDAVHEKFEAIVCRR